MSRKKTIQEVITYSNSIGWKCLSNTYKDCDTKMKFICPEGHIIYKTYSGLKNSGCKICGDIKLKKPTKYSLRFVENYIKTKYDGYVLSTEYINCDTKMIFQCKYLHSPWSIPFNYIVNYNYWCPTCNNPEKISIEYIKKYVHTKHGGQVLSKKYIGLYHKIKLKCKNGHVFYNSWAGIKKNKSLCRECSKCPRITIEKVKNFMIEKGGNCLSDEYKNNSTKMLVECKNKHQWYATWNKLQSGSYCPCCKNTYGSESAIRLFFERLFGYKFIKIRPDWLINPKTGHRLELDGYCQELNLAFEHNGMQHYKAIGKFSKSEEQLKIRQEYDAIKKQLCADVGLILIDIPQLGHIIKQKNFLDYIYNKLCENNIYVKNFYDRAENISKLYKEVNNQIS